MLVWGCGSVDMVECKPAIIGKELLIKPAFIDQLAEEQRVKEVEKAGAKIKAVEYKKERLVRKYLLRQFPDVTLPQDLRHHLGKKEFEEIIQNALRPIKLWIISSALGAPISIASLIYGLTLEAPFLFSIALLGMIVSLIALLANCVRYYNYDDDQVFSDGLGFF